MDKVSKGSGWGGERMLFMILCMYVCESVSCIADGFSSHHGVTFETTILDKFKVACGHEGETLSLGCTVIIYPTVKNYTPEVVWYKNGELTHFWGYPNCSECSIQSLLTFLTRRCAAEGIQVGAHAVGRTARHPYADPSQQGRRGHVHHACRHQVRL